MKRSMLFAALVVLFATYSCDRGTLQVSDNIYGISSLGDDPDRYDGDEVYICTGGSSKKYHRNPNCKGLRSCSKKVERVYQTFAEEKGRTQCKMCYK